MRRAAGLELGVLVDADLDPSADLGILHALQDAAILQDLRQAGLGAPHDAAPLPRLRPRFP